jgi:hypothetical protein
LPVGRNLLLRGARRKQGGARFGDIAKNRLLLLGIAFDRFHQVRNQIGAPLQDDVDLRPGRFHRFVLRHQSVADTDVLSEEDECDQHQDNDDCHRSFTHESLLHSNET